MLYELLWPAALGKTECKMLHINNNPHLCISNIPFIHTKQINYEFDKLVLKLYINIYFVEFSNDIIVNNITVYVVSASN